MASAASVQVATQTLTATGNPANAETVTIAGKVYTFQTTLTDADGNVAIGADAETSLANLKAAINLDAGAGTKYAASTTRNPEILAKASDETTLTVGAPGAVSNRIPVAETSTVLSWSGATLAGGDGNLAYWAEDALRQNQFNAEAMYEIHRLTVDADPPVPLTIAGLAAWYAADRITGLADGAAVATWADASGNGNDATQATGTAQPSYRTSVRNGKPVVRFDGGDYLAAASDLGLAGTDQSWTVIVAVKAPASFATPQAYFSFGTTEASNPSHYVHFFTTPAFRSQRIDDLGTTATIAGGTPVADTWYLVAHVFAGTTESIYVNGATVVDAGAMDIGACTFTHFALGAQIRDVPTLRLTSDIAEALVYSRALSSAERRRVEQYLADKYAITLA